MSHVSRLGALVAASALTVTGITLVASPAQAVPDTRAVGQGATWLTDQLTDGLIHNPNFGGFDDFGLSIDVALALDEIGGAANDTTVKTVGKAIRNNYYSYTTGADYFDGPEIYAGAQGKALVLAQIAGTTPTSYQATVLADLEKQVAGAGILLGRIENSNETVYPPPNFDPVPGDSANSFGQAFATRALITAGSEEADEALAFLLDQQCADGGFREKFDAKDDVSQGCDPADTATFGDRIGATATTVLNLSAVPATTDITNALAAARAWLQTQDNADGSFGADGGNANSTGIAARAIGASPEATAAAAWLRDLQIDDTDACTKAANALGAIAFTTAALADARANGIPTTAVENGKQDSVRRASAQAVPALAFLEAPDAQTLNLTGPTGYLKAGTSPTFSVTGAASDSTLCATVSNSNKAAVANGAGTAAIALTLPGGTANRTVTVTDRNGNTDTVVAKVLGAKKLTVKAARSTVRKNRSVRVTVTGLAPGEKVTLRVRRHRVAGSASANGTFVATLKPGSALGRARITATGQFADIRHGRTSVRVVR